MHYTAWSTIFIIDPLYTLPLLLGVITAVIAGRRRSWGRTVNTVGLALCTVCLAWTAGVTLHVEQVAHGALAAQRIEATEVLTTPAPFNSVLWRILAINDSRYYEGYYSLLDDDPSVAFTSHPRSLELIEPLRDTWAVRRLQWFTKNFYAAERNGDQIIITDLSNGPAARLRLSLRGRQGRKPAPGTRPLGPSLARTELGTASVRLGARFRAGSRELEQDGTVRLDAPPVLGMQR